MSTIFVGMAAIDNWHIANGKHFPDFVTTQIGNTVEEVNEKIISKFVTIYGNAVDTKGFNKNDYYNTFYVNSREVSTCIEEMGIS